MKQLNRKLALPILFIFTFISLTFCQYKCLTGYWEKKDKDFTTYLIYKNNKNLSIQVNNETIISIGVNIIGFQNILSTDTVFFKNLLLSGKYYTVISENLYLKNKTYVTNSNFFIAKEFECDEESLYIYSGTPFDYNRIQKLPTNVIILLKKKSESLNRNYIEEFSIK